jgi:hypothetical protein
MTLRRQTRRPLFSILSRIAVILLLTLALSACQDPADTTTPAPSTTEPTATPTPTPTPDPRVPYVFDLKNFDTVTTRTGETYSIEDCTFLEDGKILITTDYENDIGIVAYIDNLEFRNTDPDPSVLYEKDEQVGQANYYRYFEYLRLEGSYRLVREEQALLDAFDVTIGSTPCLVLRYEDETGTLIEKLAKKDSIVLKNKNADASAVATQYTDALSLDLTYDAFANYFPEDKKLETYTAVHAYLDQDADRAYLLATDSDGRAVEMNLPLSKIAFQTGTAIPIPETAIDMGINVPGVYTQIYFQNYSSPTYGKEIEKAYIDKDLIYITYRDIDQMTITHVDGTQIVDPINNQLRTCFELEELNGERNLMYNIPQDDRVGTGECFKMLKIGEHYFYFNKSKGTEGSLFSTRQVNFNVTFGKHDLDNGEYPEKFIDLPLEVDVMQYIQGVDSEIEYIVNHKTGLIEVEIIMYRYFKDYNNNLYIEARKGSINDKSEISNVYPAEQFVISGISLTKFKTEGVPIFDLSQGIDLVSAGA